MDYKQLGLDVFQAIGGNDNVIVVTHCATRLRFKLKDSNSVDKAEIEKIPGVLKVIEAGGQFQVVVGPSVSIAFQAVQEVFKPSASGSAENNTDVKSGEEPKKSLGARFLGTIAGIFTPILPAITAAGMVKAVLAILKVTGAIDVDGQTYAILTFAADAAFYFMPVMLAASCAKMFQMSSGLAMMLAGIMLHPTFSGMVSAGEPVYLCGILPIRLASYSTTVIPIILVVFVASYVERFANKVLPEVIKYIVRPLIVMIVMIPLSLCVLGPIGSYVGDGLVLLAQAIDSMAPWLIPTLMGIFNPILVMFGLHTSLMPIATSELATLNHETIYGPGQLASNIAQGANALAVAIRLKNPVAKQTAFSAGFTALCGITEPALYGVTLRYKRRLIPVMIGGGIAGFYAGISGLVRYSFGSPGLATLPVFIGDDGTGNFTKAIITLVLSFIITFGVSWFMKLDAADQNMEHAE